MTLKLILQLSRAGCQLDSSGSVNRFSEVTTLPARSLSSVRDSEVATQIIYYSQNLNTTAAHYYGLYCIDPSEHYAVAVTTGRHNAETTQSCFVISFVTTCKEILRRMPTVKTARTLGLCCLFSNCMECSAPWDVLLDQVMYKLLSLKVDPVSVSRSECLALVTAVTFGVRTGTGLTTVSYTLLLLVRHFRFFSIGVEFNIIFLSD